MQRTGIGARRTMPTFTSDVSRRRASVSVDDVQSRLLHRPDKPPAKIPAQPARTEIVRPLPKAVKSSASPDYYRSVPPKARVHYAKQRVATKAGKRQKRIVLALVLGALLAVGYLAASSFSRHSSGASPSAQPQAQKREVKAAQTQKPSKTLTTDTEMAAAIAATIAAHPGVEVSVDIVDINTNTSYHYGLPPSVVYVAASVSKLMTATYYLYETEQGSQTLDKVIGGKPASEQIKLMIEESDNDAWHALNDDLTRDKLAQFGKRIGLANYSPLNNTVPSADVALLLSKIQQQKVLNKQHNDYLLGLMKNANRQDFIGAALPAGVNLYHKAGWLEDRTHDAAIINDGYDPYVLVIFTKGPTEADAAIRTTVINAVTKATVSRFIGKQ